MPATDDHYLSALREALRDLDPVQIQEAVQEARSEVERILEPLSWEQPGLAPEAALARVEASLGTPEAFAARFRRARQLPAPCPLSPETASVAPWPGFFEVLAEPHAYLSLLLLGGLLPLSILVFVWVSTGLSLALGLLVIGVGFPLLVLVLGSFRALGWAHARVLEVLTGIPAPKRLPLLPRVPGFWKKLGALFTEGLTWRALLLLLLLLPLGITYFVLLVTGTSLALGTLLLPLAHVSGDLGLEVFGKGVPLWASGGLSFLGGLMLVGLLHGGLALGRLHGRLSRRLLLGE